MPRFSSWLSSLSRVLRPGSTVSRGWGSPPPPPVRRGFRPSVEALEGREVPAVFAVTNALDAGAGSLRQAINQANAHVNAGGVADRIEFNIAGAEAHTISLQSALPPVTEAVVIDGTTQPGPAGVPVVELNGTLTGDNGLVLLNHTGSTVKGLVINRFAGNGLLLLGGGGHAVSGNFIGTDLGGTVDRGNRGDGIRIAQSRNNTLRGNLLSGNGDDGVEIAGVGATGNRLIDNRIGTNRDGTAGLGNDADGVLVTGAASANRIVQNIISANLDNGIELIQGASANAVRGNKIGTDVTGSVDLGNGAPGGDGVRINAADGNVIGGSTPGAGNLISGNGDFGVDVEEASGNRIEGNRIGTDATGLLPLGNASGMFLDAARNTLVRNNVISASSFAGVVLGDGAAGNALEGNLVGLGADGKTPLGNGEGGIELVDARNNRIGGPAPGQRNVIAANGVDGILIAGASTSGNVVQGNFIGTDRTGTRALGNDGNGVHITDGASGNLVGGPKAAHRNVVSGNGDDGVDLESSGGNVVQGNFIGTDRTGSKALGNEFGVFLNNADDTLVHNNVISANLSQGVLIGGEAFANSIRGNRIGVGADGRAPLGNGQEGIRIDGSSRTVIRANVIAHNGQEGVALLGSPSIGNTLSRNRIFANGALGIDLNGDGPTANDPLDPDGSPNNLQNFPVLSTAIAAAGQTALTGALESTPGARFRIELFANPPGGDEGAAFLGSVLVTADAQGKATFAFVLGRALKAGSTVTATATNRTTGDTSEFSAPLTVKAGA